MCACEEHTANNTCPEPFELVGILGIAETLGYHIVKDQHHFVVEERLIKLNDIRLADFILVLAVIVDGLTLSAYPHVLVAVFRSCQFTHPVAESLVAEFVALACGCWNGGEDDVHATLAVECQTGIFSAVRCATSS